MTIGLILFVLKLNEGIIITIQYMNNTKANLKRGRPKRKNSEDGESSDQFTKKKQSKKAQKAATINKKTTEGDKPKTKKAQLKSKVQFSDSSESDSSHSIEQKEQPTIKIINIPIQMFKPDKLFAQILNKANKQPDFLIMLRNLLSGCSRILRDKRNFLNKKWQNLRNSNCTQDEYISRESQLKRMEIEEIYEIQKDIMSKLLYANIKGFQSKENLINDYKHSLVDPVSKTSKIEVDAQYTIDEETWNKYHDLQKKLLSLLLNEKDLVYTNSMQPIRSNTSMPNVRDKQVNQQNQMEGKINTLDTEQNPQSTQFLFCKYFSQINYDKVFQNQTNPFKLNQNDIYYMDPKALSWILQTKSDQIYTNEKFQKQTYKRYTQLLQSIYLHSKEVNDQNLIEQLLEIAAYILNSVHYYQKFKLKCDLLHPLDLLLVIEKIKKQRKNRENRENHTQNDQNFNKQIDGFANSIKAIAEAINGE